MSVKKALLCQRKGIKLYHSIRDQTALDKKEPHCVRQLQYHTVSGEKGPECVK